MLVSLTCALLTAQTAQRPGQNRRGAAGTREFLGLGRQPDEAAAARGKPLFVSNCSFCHGANARGGDTGPDLLRSAVVLHDDKGEEIGPVVRNGRTARGMPAFPGSYRLAIGRPHRVSSFAGRTRRQSRHLPGERHRNRQCERRRSVLQRSGEMQHVPLGDR